MVDTAESLPKIARVAKRRDYLRTYDEGRKVFGRFVVLFFAPRDSGPSRIGVTATKKIGTAAVRNRLKRWTREVYRRQRVPLALDGLGCDFIVNVKAAATTVTFAEYRDDLIRAISRAAREATR